MLFPSIHAAELIVARLKVEKSSTRALIPSYRPKANDALEKIGAPAKTVAKADQASESHTSTPAIASWAGAIDGSLIATLFMPFRLAS